MRHRPATPPMTPPAMAPTFVDLVELLLTVVPGVVLIKQR